VCLPPGRRASRASARRYGDRRVRAGCGADGCACLRAGALPGRRLVATV